MRGIVGKKETLSCWRRKRNWIN